MPLRINTSAAVPEIYIYDEIGPGWAGMIDALALIDAFEQIGPAAEICLRINSPGGDVFEAIAMIGAMERNPAKIITECDGLAASAGSYLFNAGDTRRIARQGEVMIHQAWTMAMGNQDELRSTLSALEDVDRTAVEEYAARTGDKATAEDIAAWLKAETWMNASTAVERGFADEIIERKGTAAAKVARGRYKHTPKDYLDSRTWEQQLRSIAAIARGSGQRSAVSDQQEEEREAGSGKPEASASRAAIAARVAIRRKALGLDR